MKITVIAVGRLKEEYLNDAQDHYLSRIKSRVGIQIVEVRDEPDPPKNTWKLLEKVKSSEAERILAAIPANTRPVLLDIQGKMTDVKEYIKKNKDADIAFIIGGSNGFGKEVYKKVMDSISFSAMTFPHQLARIILLEALDKAFL